MSPRLKIALAVVAGMIGGMFLLGTALAIPAALHGFGGRESFAERGYGPGMMGRGEQDQRGQFDGRGTCPRFDGEGRGFRGDTPRDGQGCGAYRNFDDRTAPNSQDGTDTTL